MAMQLDRYFADAQTDCDLLVEQSCDNQFHHFTLTRRQLFKTPAQVCRFRPLPARRAVTINRLSDGVEQVLIAKGLGQMRM